MIELDRKSQDSKSHFSFPRIHEYERQKGFHVIHRKSEPRALFSGRAQFGLRGATRSRELKSLFAQRISCALSGRNEQACPIFPGHLIAGPAQSDSGDAVDARNRGILYYEQFKNLLAHCHIPDADNLLQCLSLKPIVANGEWCWTGVEQPQLQYVQLKSTPFGTTGCSQLLDELWLQSRPLLDDGRIVDLLELVHRAWAYSNKAPVYTNKAILVCRPWLEQVAQVTSRDLFLAVLFEIEAYASFASASASLTMVGGGAFAGNWIEVGNLPLNAFRATELCQHTRLLEELVNLVERGFAPIVVNEDMCVADGNHRLTASWLWNLLCFTADLNWDLADQTFQSAVANFARDHILQPVIIHETLHHLALFLRDGKAKNIIEQRIRPLVARSRQVESLLATILPEYLSGAVVKSLYDSGVAVQRAEPLLYEIMVATPNTVLPARASYHFTDRALLPWFPVLQGL